MSVKISPAKPCFSEDDIKAITDRIGTILSNGWLTSGPVVQEFEKKFAEYLGVKHVIATNNGTSALACVLKALGVKETTVLVPDCTFAATAHAVLWTDGSIRLVDIEDPATFNVGVATVEREFKEARSRNEVVSTVMVVHIGGHPVDMDPIRDFCRDHNLFLVEDAAHAHGAEYKGRKCGTLSDAACFSFYPTKLLTTGEGGAIATNNDELAERCRSITNQGRRTLYTNDIEIDGFNFRMSDVNAAIGIVQLGHLDKWVDQRQKLAQEYKQLLSDVQQIELPVERPYAKHNYYKYACLVRPSYASSADDIKKKLSDRGVPCGMTVFWPPLHQTTFYNKYNETHGYPIADKVLPRQLCLPMHSAMTEAEVHYASEQLWSVLEK